MREKFKKIVAYIFRSWEGEKEEPIHPSLKILPPFLIELLGDLITIVILCLVVLYFWYRFT